MIERVLPSLDEGVHAPADLSGLPGLTVTADAGQHACRLRLTGALDQDTLPLLTACLGTWVERGMSHLVIDLTAVTSVDSAAAAALSRAAHVLGRSGGSVHVVANDELADGALQASGLDFIAPNNTDQTIRIGVRHDG